MKNTYFIHYVDLDNPKEKAKIVSAQFENYPTLSELGEAIALVDPESKSKRIGILMITTSK